MLEMTTVPGELIWEIVKKNNCFLVKEFGNGTAGVKFSKEPNNLCNVHSYKYLGWQTVTIQPGKDQSVQLQKSGIHKEVISLVVKLSNGLHKLNEGKTFSNMDGVSSHLMKCYEVKGPLKLIWTIDILQENSMEIQVIKIWDILPLTEIPKLAKKLDFVIGNYTLNHISRCLCKRIEG